MKTILQAIAIAAIIIFISFCLDWFRPIASREDPDNANSLDPLAETAIANIPELVSYQQWQIVATEAFPDAPAPSQSPADPEPNPLERRLWILCAPASFDPAPLGEKINGPHFVPGIRVRVNDLAYPNFANTAASLPANSVVVKEKFANVEDAAPVALGVMIKREAGYDPEGGDWEYVYLDGRNFERVTRGQLASCRSCHASQSNADFLFRAHLKR